MAVLQHIPGVKPTCQGASFLPQNEPRPFCRKTNSVTDPLSWHVLSTSSEPRFPAFRRIQHQHSYPVRGKPRAAFAVFHACRKALQGYLHRPFVRRPTGREPRPGEIAEADVRARHQPISSDPLAAIQKGPPAVYHPCFVTRLGGVSAGKETQGWRDSSHTAMVGAGKFGSAKAPMATAMYTGKPSLSQ